MTQVPRTTTATSQPASTTYTTRTSVTQVRTTPTTPAATSPTTAPSTTAREQIVVVRAAGYGITTAQLAAYQQTTSGWQRVFGPWTANIGRNGVAPPGAKREGDGRTPSGRYGFSFFFGIAPDPGVKFAYRRVTSPTIVWDDDPASPNYNEWVDTRTGSAGANPEPMYNAPVYNYGAVVAYNPARTPGLGSAIFLPVSLGRPTAGCIGLPTPELLALLRWLDPARSPTILIGTNSYVDSTGFRSS